MSSRYQASFMLKSAVKDNSQNSFEMNDDIMNPEQDPKKIREIKKGWFWPRFHDL